MALTGTDRGTGGNNASASTIACSPTSTIVAGSLGVLKIALDNSGAAGAATVAPASVTDSVGNTWTRRQNALFDNGVASTGVELAIYTAPITTQVTSSNNVTLNFGTATVAKAYAFEEFTAGVGKLVSYVTGGVNTGSTTGAPTVTTGSITSGDAVAACGGMESADTWAGDADTSNGSWSTHQHTAFGSGTSGMSITSQRKIVTGTAAQTYNPTATSADCILAWIQLRELNAYSLVADTVSFTETGNAANLLFGRKVVTTVGAFTETGLAAGLLWKHVITAGVGSFVLGGVSAGLLRGYPMVAASGSFALTGNDVTLTYAPAAGVYTLTAASGSFALTGTATGLRHDYTVAAGAGSFSWSGAAAGLLAGRKVIGASGSYALGASDVSLAWKRVLTAAVGSLSLQGVATSLLWGRRVAAGIASYSLGGNAAGLVYTPLAGAYSLHAAAGVFTVSGQGVQMTVVVPVFPGQRRRFTASVSGARIGPSSEPVPAARMGSSSLEVTEGRVGSSEATPTDRRIGGSEND